MKKEDFMRLAIRDAKENKHHFGAVVVKGNKVIAKAGKRPIGDARYHAETTALLKATKKLGVKRFPKGCMLYTTCEPCVMCFYMAWITGISKIVYGATLQDALKFGFQEIDINIDELNRKGGNRVKLRKGFLRDECLALFKR
ncbi:MAG: nucleoside deaminase [archaeon]|nr:nucleoside deaminase [archaeon]